VDCFAGSGTTGAVARKTGRRAILIEKREAQCRAIVQRLAQRDLLTANA
jgi:site-specific DNA-methyltransferase (adenine-specific)